MPFPCRRGRHRRCHRSTQSSPFQQVPPVVVVDVVAVRRRAAGQRQGLVARSPSTLTRSRIESRSRRSASSFSRTPAVELERIVVLSVAVADRVARRAGSSRRKIGLQEEAAVVVAVVVEKGGGGGGGGGGDSPPRCTRCRTERDSPQTQVETRGSGRRPLSRHRLILLRSARTVVNPADEINDPTCPPLASPPGAEEDPWHRRMSS